MDEHRHSRSLAAQVRVLIDRAALLHNVEWIRGLLSPGVQIHACVKAEAYGHGAAIVADTLCHFAIADDTEPPVHRLIVATVEEASAIPVVPRPITILRPAEMTFVGRTRDLYEHAIRRGWTLTLSTNAAADDLSRIARKLNVRALVQIMVDTGLTRCGVDVPQLQSLVDRVRRHPELRLESLGTHFADADASDQDFTREQLRRFRAATDEMVIKSEFRLTRHAANSAAALTMKESHLDAIRVGAALYGIDPIGTPSVERRLIPAMKWLAPLVGVRQIEKGVSVGYGRMFTADKPMRIGLVPVGYADGYPRLASSGKGSSGKASVIVRNRPCAVVGRVSMDLLTIDLSDVPDAVIGDDVTLIDPDPLSPASMYALANASQTIAYEIVTRIGLRVRRVAVGVESPQTR